MRAMESKVKSQAETGFPKMEWHINIDRLESAKTNMARDSGLLAACGQGDIPPTLRLYGWSEPSITIGYSQNAEAELDLDRCREMGVPVVRRPTGGRALLHYKELTYSVVAPVSLAPFRGGLKATFATVSQALLAGLSHLGIQGEINDQKPSLRPKYTRNPACFASLNHCEITVGGKKLVGSAQKRTSRAFLQHGSIVMESCHDLFVSLLKFKEEQKRREVLQRLENTTTSLNHIGRRQFTFDETASAFMAGFQEAFDGIWKEGFMLNRKSPMAINDSNFSTGIPFQ